MLEEPVKELGEEDGEVFVGAPVGEEVFAELPIVSVALIALQVIGTPVVEPVGGGATSDVALKFNCEVPVAKTVKVRVAITPLPLTPDVLSSMSYICERSP